MKIIKIKRVWNNIASIRDYMIKRAIQDNESITVELVGTKEHMLLTPEIMKSKSFQISTRKFKSKFDGNEYELVDFSWRPEAV